MTGAGSLVVVGMDVADQSTVLGQLADRLGAELAHLQARDPALHRVLDRLADGGVERVVLLGVAIGTAPGHSWLRRIAADWWRSRADPPDLVVAGGLLDDIDADPGPLLAAARPVTGREPGLTSAAWEEVPGHRRHVLVCRGPRCTARGSDETAVALVRGLMEAGLGDDDVLLTQTGCLFPCNQAPVVVVHPDDVWYGGVDAAAAAEVVTCHLVGGEAVDTVRLPRGTGDGS